jgi:hypothetical protein
MLETTVGRSRFAGCALALSLPLALSLIGGGALASDWAGTETTDEEGVLHVMNPPEPMSGEETVGMTEMWRIGGDTDDDAEFFGVLNQVTTDEAGNVYLLDRQLTEVKIFSPDGEYINTIGREGEGPGEFRRPSDLFVTPDGHVAVMQGAPGKIILLTRDGQPAGEYPMPASDDGGFRFFSGGRMKAGQVVLAMSENAFNDDGMTRSTHLVRVDDAGAETARYMTLTTRWRRSDTIIDESDSRGWWVNWDMSPDGRVFANWEFGEYAVHVWNADGTKDRVIEMDYEPRVRSADEKEQAYQRMSGFIRRIPNSELRISENAQAIQNIFVRDDGSLWVLSSRGAIDAPEGSIGQFDVYDKDGRFAKRITLEGEGDYTDDGYFFSKDRLYVVLGLRSSAAAMQGGRTDSDGNDVDIDEAEPIAVVCYELDGVNL